MQQFYSDMSIMYKIRGKSIVNSFLIIEALAILMAFSLFRHVDYPIVFQIIAILFPILAFVHAYLGLYFRVYKPMFKEIREEDRLQKQYSYLYERFIRQN